MPEPASGDVQALAELRIRDWLALGQQPMELDHRRIGHHHVGELRQQSASLRLVLRDPPTQLTDHPAKEAHQFGREPVVERRRRQRRPRRSLIHPTKTGQRALPAGPESQRQRPHHRARVDLATASNHAALARQAFEFGSRQHAGLRLSDPNRRRSGHGQSPVPVEASKLQSDQRSWPTSTPCASLHHAAIRTRMPRALRTRRPVAKERAGEGAALRAGPRGRAVGVPLSDLCVAIDTNLERGLRPVPTGRRNWLFAWTELGAERIGVIQSLLVTCRLHGIDLYAYLVDVLHRVGEHPAARAVELTPRIRT